VQIPASSCAPSALIADSADLIKEAVLRGEYVLVIAYRRELIEQASQKLTDAGIEHGIIQAGPDRPEARVQIASIQTLTARAVRTCKIPLPPADLLVFDECHHVRAKTYMRLVAAYPNVVILGLTATPCRADGRGLGRVFQALVEAPSVAELTRLGYLVPAKIFAPVRPNLKGVKVRLGDYVESQLAERMNTAKLVGDTVTHWHRLGEGRRTVVFTVNVAHSVHITCVNRLPRQTGSRMVNPLIGTNLRMLARCASAICGAASTAAPAASLNRSRRSMRSSRDSSCYWLNRLFCVPD
jgi:superfamily II DNA or RNA helicase